jgi:CelD/BcsL family acetyltransferase involved in cellulose biosynthesis
MSALEVEEVTTSVELEALAPAWDDLWRRAPAATPFHSPNWLIPWWREIGDGELRVILALRAGRLVGVLPMYLQHESGKLLPLGIAISDYLDGLFKHDDASAIAGAMLRRLTNRHDWRRCEVHPLRGSSPLLEAPPPPGCVDQVLEFEPCLVLETAGARHLREAIPSGMRAKLRQAERRAEQAGRVSFETATAESLAEVLEAFFRLHEARWAARDDPGVLAGPAIRGFHHAAAPRLLGAGLLRLHVVRLDERIVAVVYALAAKGRTYSYLSGFDPEFGSISPGTLAVGYAIGEAIAEGAREFDFLRGREAFKYRWGARERPCYGRMLNRVR